MGFYRRIALKENTEAERALPILLLGLHGTHKQEKMAFIYAKALQMVLQQVLVL